VTWRYSGDYCGWAPLPPRTHYRSGFGLSYFSGSVGVGFSFGLASDCYTFVPWRGFCDPHPFRNRLPHHRVKNVFNNTTIVNNFHRGDHRRVVNRGISPDRVSEFSGRRVNEVALGNAERRTVRGWQRDNDGDSSRREMARRTDAPAGAFAPAATRGDNDRSRRLEGGNSLAERQGRMLNQRSGERDDNTPDSAPDFRRGNVRSEVSRSDDNQRGDAASPIMRRSVGGIGDNERDNNSRNLPSRFQRDQRIAEAPGRDDNSPQATPSPDNRGHPSVVIRQTPSRDLSRPNRFTPPSTTTTPVAPSTTQPRQIGRAQAAAPTLDARSRSTHTWTAPERTQSPVQRQEIQRPEIQRPQVQRPQIQRQEIQRQDVSRFTPQIRNQSQSPPSRFQPSPTPRANVPSQPRTVTPSFPAPERSRPIPQQRFTPAPVQRAPSVESRPAPSREVRSQPAQSNSRGSDGGDNSRGGGGGNRGGGGDGGGRSRR
jgi:uncharacterized membrane protein YgcG